MCRRCIFKVHPKRRYLLSERGVTNRWENFTPNESQKMLLHLCRHDKKRVAWARSIVDKPHVIRNWLMESLERGEPLVPYADLLVTYGQTFITPDFSDSWSACDDAWGKCYVRSYFHAKEYSDILLYAEGLTLTYVTAAFEMRHAWNVTRYSSEVFDSTWPMSHWNQYFGIVIDLEWVKENCIMECGIFHPDNWPHNEERVRHYLQLQWLEKASVKGGGR